MIHQPTAGFGPWCRVALLFGSLAVTVVIAGPPRATATEAATSQLGIVVQEDRLSLDLVAVPLGDVLAALAEKAEIAVELRGEANEPVTFQVDVQPLHLAISEFLNTLGYSYILEFAADPTEGQARRLSKLTVIVPDGPAAAPMQAVEGQGARPGTEEPVPFEAEDLDAADEAIQILEEILREETDPDIRDAAAEALSDIEKHFIGL